MKMMRRSMMFQVRFSYNRASFEVLEPSLSAGGLQFDDAWQQMANADAVCVHALAEVQRAQSLFSNAKDALIEASIGLSMAQGHYAQALHGSYVDARATSSESRGLHMRAEVQRASDALPIVTEGVCE